MRTVKFRGKRTDNGEWVYGNLVTMDSSVRYGDSPISSNYWIVEIKEELKTDAFSNGNAVWAHNEFIQVIPETVGQFIGVLDKHKKEIFEGQTIRDTINDMWYKVVFNGGRYIGQIVMHGAICGGTNIDDISKLHTLFYEIIEPELLEVKP
jgi:uncharacterized phage protein (TIGR01671 family)